MANEMTYTVNVTREDGAWLADVPTVPGAHTFAHSLEGLTKSVREVIILMDDLPDDTDVDIDFRFETDDDAVAEAERLRRERAHIDSRMDDLIVDTARLVTILTRQYSMRDAAIMLGITPGRVSQLTSAKS